MAGKKIGTEPGKRDAIEHYYSEMGGVQLLGREREITLFREIEKAEHAFIMHMLLDEDILDSLIPMLDKLSTEKGVEADHKRAIKSFILGDRSESCTKKFVRAIRFTEAGRFWLEAKTRKIPNRNTPSWKKKASNLKIEYLKLKNSFVDANLRLVVMIAKKNMRSWFNLTVNDLIQEGNMGLIKAVDKYDVDKGYRFATYATWWIRHYVKRAIAEKDALIRLPVHVTETIGRIKAIENNYAVVTGDKLDDDEIIIATDMNESKVRNAMKHRRGNKILSLDSPLSEEGEMTLSDVLPDTDSVDPEYATYSTKMNMEVRSLLTSLTPVQSSVLRLRFGLDCNPHTLEEIGEKYHLTRERIRQIEATALRKLRMRAGALRYAGDFFFSKTG